MAVGKGSMARASKAAAAKKVDVKAAVVEKVEEAVVAEVKEEAPKAKATVKKAAPKKETAKKEAAPKKTTAKKATPKKEEAVAAGVVVEATSEQVMNEIVYQKSAQVLDREPEANETFGIGEAMPIYLF